MYLRSNCPIPNTALQERCEYYKRITTTLQLTRETWQRQAIYYALDHLDREHVAIIVWDCTELISCNRT